ncbi:MAG: hypothetical protein WBH15_09175 [Candidatus Methanoculleus thermohydrogenotrophicum]
MRENWRVRRGWITVHGEIDVATSQIPGLGGRRGVPDDRMFVLRSRPGPASTTAARNIR